MNCYKKEQVTRLPTELFRKATVAAVLTFASATAAEEPEFNVSFDGESELQGCIDEGSCSFDDFREDDLKLFYPGELGPRGEYLNTPTSVLFDRIARADGEAIIGLKKGSAVRGVWKDQILMTEVERMEARAHVLKLGGM